MSMKLLPFIPCISFVSIPPHRKTTIYTKTFVLRLVQGIQNRADTLRFGCRDRDDPWYVV